MNATERSLLVFGRTGQVARALSDIAPDAQFLGRDGCDLFDPEACASAIRMAHPSAVINAAAYTAVDRAEKEEQLATVINGQAPGAMATACAELDVPFVQISTDYVFDGVGNRAFEPLDKTDPSNAYGRSKLLGEDAVRAVGGQFAILRTSWLFSAHGSNFVKTMLRLGAEQSKLTVVGDQIGGPTPASGIAQACLAIAEELPRAPQKAGTYHYSGAPDVSWADFARAIFAQAGMEVVVEDIPTRTYPTLAHRPLNSRLDCASLFTQFGIRRPRWNEALAQTVKDLGH